MAWFHHTVQDSNQPQASMKDLQSSLITSAPVSSSQAPALLPSSFTDWSAVAPPSLGDLSCTPSPSPRLKQDPEPLSYVTLQEQRCVLSWFLGWAFPQRERFLQDLISKAVPGKVSSLLEQLNILQVKDRPPNIFECQLRLWTQWFESWSEEERNAFLNSLEERDPGFVAQFYTELASTAGKD